MHLLKLAIRPWRTNPILQVFSAFASGVALFSAALAGWCAFSLEPVVNRLSSEQVITAYLDPELPQDQEDRVVGTIRDTIRSALGAQAINEPKLVRAPEFIAQVREEYPDLAEQLEGLGTAELDAVVPRYVSMAGSFEPGTLEALRSVKGVGSIETSAHKTATLVGSLGAVRWIAILVALALFAATCALTIHVTRFNSQQYGDALAFLRLMGGGAMSSRLPGVLSGAFFGAVAGLIAAVAWQFGADLLLAQLRVMAPVLTDLSSVPRLGVAVLASAGILTGLVSGTWAGAFATGRAAGGGRAWL